MEKSDEKIKYVCQHRKIIFGPRKSMKDVLPPNGSEVTIKNIPSDMKASELFSFLEQAGELYQMVFMTGPVDKGSPVTYAFAIYVQKEGAEKARNKFHRYEIRPNFRLRVTLSVDKRYVKVMNIPADKTKDEILQEMSSYLRGIIGLCVRPNREKNCQIATFKFKTFTWARKAKNRFKNVRFTFFNGIRPIFQWPTNVKTVDREECEVVVGEQYQGAVAEKKKESEVVGGGRRGAGAKKRKQPGDCIGPDMNIKLQKICEGIDEIVDIAQERDADPAVMDNCLQRVRDDVDEVRGEVDEALGCVSTILEYY
ncbi:hypothetical protein CDAR_504581 [Caerostris darwini]|uniref:RRM domain-containing protein n=1 Tax=Caerostris darwini TaxID=1538125 RepID=A0AAV4SC88_9ARAC|nr:hypothetical protein CDAR_504581 [Caerostris darwini]